MHKKAWVCVSAQKIPVCLVDGGGMRGVKGEGLLCLFGSEAVGQLFCEPERFGFVHRTHQVPHTSSPPLLQHQPARVLPSRLLLCSLLCPLPLQPAEQRKRTVAIKSELNTNLTIKTRCVTGSVTEVFNSIRHFLV